MSLLELKAVAFASLYHFGQVRKYTGEAYINHPIAVAELVKTVPHTDEMVAAAILHDTVEDTKATTEDIRREFGEPVAVLVEMLTNVSRLSDGNRAVRKAIDRMHLAKASNEAKTIKLADTIHNAESIIKNDPNFAKVFLAEKRDLLKVLVGGDPTLFARAMEIVGG